MCTLIEPVDNRTSVLVLQHPREHLHPIGTARFAGLGLCNARVEVAWNANRLERQPPPWLPSGAALLYPTPDARDLRTLSKAEYPRHLVVIDGTWHTARTLYRDKHWLHALPRYRFVPKLPGQYRIRREPQADYLSTIEAILEALQILEPETAGLERLRGAFHAMIDYQLSHIAHGHSRSRKPSRRRPVQELRIPHALLRDFDRLVVVYGEAARARGDAQRARGFVSFGAVALGTGRSFARVIVPDSGMPEAPLLQHMGLTKAHFDGATSPELFRREWLEFLDELGCSPLLAAWSERTLAMLAEATERRAAGVSLKSAYRAVHGTTARGPEEAMHERQLHAADNPLCGRARKRLGAAVAIARYLHERGTTRAAPDAGHAS